MIFGHNTNVNVGAHKYHVQTEDAGPSSALIDTTVYAGGRVLHRRTNNYLDLLPLNADTEKALKLRLDEQHRQVLEEIRTGALCLPPPTPAPPTPTTSISSHAAQKAQSESLSVELLNPKTWLAGKRVTLQLRVTDGHGHPVAGAKITTSVSGATEPANFFSESAATGEAHLAFDMPRLTDPNATLLIEATRGPAKAHLRFQLRARQRIPVA
ncbi:MAG TPA: Ig-like domain-containing protein [Candidatus Acidoferrum sp.]|jgi:hypothetical protein|nr:Ig-like domain-containing protein [Candidatus Acidoferrum sp.]